MKAVVLLLLSISLCCAQNSGTDSISPTVSSPSNITSGNETVVPPTYPNCNTFNPNCDGNGVCNYDGTCRCYHAYFGPANSDAGGPGGSCPYNVTMIPGSLAYIRPVMTYSSVIFTVLFCLELYRLVIELVMIKNRVVFDVTNAITVWTLSLLTFHGILGMMDGYNYWGTLGLLPYKVVFTVFALKDRIILILFTSLLFHWAELYYSAIRRMKREEMLRKLKPDYQTNLTIEDVILKINFVSKFRFMYALLGVLNLITFIISISIHLSCRDLNTALTYQKFDSCFLTVSYILYFIAYIIYGVRLLTILPASLRPRIKIVMILLGIYAVMGVLNQVLQLSFAFGAFGAGEGLGAINYVYGWSTFPWICAFCALNIFMPIWEWHKWFNPMIVKSMVVSTRTGFSSSGTGSRKAKESQAMESSVEMSTGPAEEVAIDIPRSEV